MENENIVEEKEVLFYIPETGQEVIVPVIEGENGEIEELTSEEVTTGALSDFAKKVYYWATEANRRYPYKSDKWRHCWTSMVIGRKYGLWVSASAGILKEVADYMGLGTADVKDIVADHWGLSGVYAGRWTTCRAWWGGYPCWKLWGYAQWANMHY